MVIFCVCLVRYHATGWQRSTWQIPLWNHSGYWYEEKCWHRLKGTLHCPVMFSKGLDQQPVKQILYNLPLWDVLMAAWWYMDRCLWCRFSSSCLETMKKLTSGRLRMISAKSSDVEQLTHSCYVCQGLRHRTRQFNRVANRCFIVCCVSMLITVNFCRNYVITDHSEHLTTCVCGTTTLAKANSAAGTSTMSLFVMSKQSRAITLSWTSGWQLRKMTDRLVCLVIADVTLHWHYNK